MSIVPVTQQFGVIAGLFGFELLQFKKHQFKEKTITLLPVIVSVWVQELSSFKDLQETACCQPEYGCIS